MKIDGFGSGGSVTGVGKAASQKTEKTKSKSKSVAQASSPASEGDSVSIESHAQTLSFIKDLVEASPDMRADEIDRVIAKMKEPNGYRINLELVAEGFLREAILQELSIKRGGNLK
jgi:flagellar biosynthesis anti-sigma factor FlgM